MKGVVKKVISLSVFLVLGIGMILVCIASARDERSKNCQGVKIDFTDNFNFVTEEDIKNYLSSGYGTITGMKKDSVNLSRIERILDVQSAIRKSEAYLDGNGILHIEISQREPVVRFQKGDSGFYADERGFIFPLQRNYTSRVPIIDGEIPLFHESNYKGEPQGVREVAWMNGVMDLITFLDKNRKWSENIVQIHVGRNGDIVMIPREGKEKFVFGDLSDIEKKFARIEKYYEYIKPLEKNYATITVKYNNQIICR